MKLTKHSTLNSADKNTTELSSLGCLTCSEWHRNNTGQILRLETQESGLHWCSLCGTLWEVDKVEKVEKKTKSRKIDTSAIIKNIDTGCIANMGFETPWVDFELPSGEILTWWSENVPYFDCTRLYSGVEGEYIKTGDTVNLKGFVRQRTGRLFKVQLNG